MISKPAVAKFKYNLDSDNEASRQLATTPGREIVGIYLTGGAGGAAARVHDSSNGAGPTKDSILIAANAGETTPIAPTQPIPMKNGIFIIIEQGVGTGAELFILYN